MPTCFREPGRDKWTLVWRDWQQIDGRWRPRRRKLMLATSRAKALALGVRLEHEADERRHTSHPTPTPVPVASCLVPSSSASPPLSLAAALDRWRADLAGTSRGHVRASLAVLRAVTRGLPDHADVTSPATLTPGMLLDYLDRLRGSGASPVTIEHHRSRARAFAKFLHETLMVIDRNPWLGVRSIARRGKRRAQRHGPDARYERRPLTDDEIARLLAAAGDPAADAWTSYAPSSKYPSRKRRSDSKGPITLTPRDRLLIYRLALEAGLRLGDVRALHPEHVLPPTSPAGPALLLVKSKAQDPTLLPINAALARDLAGLAADRPIGRPIWRLEDSLAPALRMDLAAARPPIPAHHPGDPTPGTPEARAHWKTGRSIRDVIDFHSLRHTFVLRGALNPNLTPRELQAAARHKQISTTLEVYARLPDARLRAAVDKLHPLPAPLTVPTHMPAPASSSAGPPR